MTPTESELQYRAGLQHLTHPLASWLKAEHLLGKLSTVQQHSV